MLTISPKKINPYIRSAMHSVLRGPITSASIDRTKPNPYGWTPVKNRILYDYELIYIESGAFVLLYDNKNYMCATGQFILIHPGVSHAFTQVTDAFSQPNIHFDFIYEDTSETVGVSFKDRMLFSKDELKLIRRDIFQDYQPSPLIKFTDSDRALKLFYDVINSNDDPLFQKGSFILLIDLMIKDNFPNILSDKEDPVSQLKRYIDFGYAFKSDLFDLETLFGYNKFHLEKLFKAKYGVSIIKYKNSVKWAMAKPLLHKYSVSETSEKLGYQSVYAFSNAFKKEFGTSPSEYKNTL